MNALTPRSPGQAMQSAVAPAEPRMSRDLALDVDRMIDPDPAARALRQFDPHAFTPAQREEAAWAAEQYRKLMAPVTRSQLVGWLGAVNAACRNPQDAEDLQVRIQAIGQDCAHLPGACFTAESRRALYAETRFFPSAGDVLAVLEPLAKRMQAKVAALDKIAAPPLGPRTVAEDGRRVPPSAEVVAQVASQVRLMKEDLAARRQDLPGGHEGNPVTPRRLSPAQLADTLREQVGRGGPLAGAAALRLAVLERQMGAARGTA